MKSPEDYGRIPPQFRRRRRRAIEADLAGFKPHLIELDAANINATLRARTPQPEERVKRQHEYLFRSGQGIGWPKYRVLGDAIAQLIKEGEAFLGAIEWQLEKQPDRLVLNEAGTPWTPLAWIKVLASVALIVAAMVMGGMLITTSLVNAGLFETKLEASGSLIVPLVGPFALKTLACWMSNIGLGRFVWVLGTATVLLLISWCVLFAGTFADALSPEPNLFLEGGEAAGGGGSSWALMCTGLLAEACFAAVLFLGIEHVAESHQMHGPNKLRKRLERVATVAGESVGWLKETALPRCTEIIAWHENAEAALIGRALDELDTVRNTLAVVEQRITTRDGRVSRLDQISLNGTPTGEER